MNKFKAYAQAYEQRTNYTIACFCRISTSFTNKFRVKENIHIKYYVLNITYCDTKIIEIYFIYILYIYDVCVCVLCIYYSFLSF